MAATSNAFRNPFTSTLDASVRQHLKNVYGCLSLSTVSAAAGAYIHMYTQLLQANLLTSIGTLGLLIALISTHDNGKNRKLRLGYLLGFAFLSGLGLGPLLELVISINPSIVMTALIGTTVVFVCFSISALLAERGRWLCLGGTLMSMLTVTTLLSLFNNLFWGSTFINQAHLYMGLFAICGFVIYDTQLIIEKYHIGNRDFIKHSLDLFIDFISILRHLLVILSQKELESRQSKDSRKRKD